MRISVLLLAFLLVAGALAGCAGRGGGFAPARPLLAVAQESALAWQADASLQSVSGVEARNGTEMAQSHPNATAVQSALLGDDPLVGDGRAPTWGFRFYSKSANLTFIAVVSSAGRILATKEDRPTSTSSALHPIALEAWQVDSDRAWQLVKEKNATFRTALAAADVVADSVLLDFGYGPHPLWLVVAGKDNENKPLMLLVDAQNGTLYDFNAYLQQILRGLLPVFRESGAYADILEPYAPGSVTYIPLNQDIHHELVVTLQFGPETPPGQRISLVMMDQAGKAVLYLNHTRALTPFDMPEPVTLEAPRAETYAVQVVLDPVGLSGVVADYSMTWCTDGIAIPDNPFGNQPAACDFVKAGQGPKGTGAVWPL